MYRHFLRVNVMLGNIAFWGFGGCIFSLPATYDDPNSPPSGEIWVCIMNLTMNVTRLQLTWARSYGEYIKMIDNTHMRVIYFQQSVLERIKTQCQLLRMDDRWWIIFSLATLLWGWYLKLSAMMIYMCSESQIRVYEVAQTYTDIVNCGKLEKIAYHNSHNVG